MATACTDIVVLTGNFLNMAELAGIYELLEDDAEDAPVYRKKGGGEAYIWHCGYGYQWEISGKGECEDHLEMISGSTTAVTPDLVDGWYYDTSDGCCSENEWGEGSGPPMADARVVKFTPAAAQEACQLVSELAAARAAYPTSHSHWR